MSPEGKQRFIDLHDVVSDINTLLYNQTGDPEYELEIRLNGTQAVVWFTGSEIFALVNYEHANELNPISVRRYLVDRMFARVKEINRINSVNYMQLVGA